MPQHHHHQRRSISNEELDPQLTSVSRQVIGAAIEIHRALGPGFERDVYLNAFEIELNELGVSHRMNHKLPVFYKGEEVGKHTLDLYVNDRFAVCVLADRREVGGLEITALRAQLRAADLELGLIINFGNTRLKEGLKRVLNPDKLNKLRGLPEDDEEDDDDSHESAYESDEE